MPPPGVAPVSRHELDGHLVEPLKIVAMPSPLSRSATPIRCARFRAAANATPKLTSHVTRRAPVLRRRATAPTARRLRGIAARLTDRTRLSGTARSRARSRAISTGF
jgi:hypothetical protein